MEAKLHRHSAFGFGGGWLGHFRVFRAQSGSQPARPVDGPYGRGGSGYAGSNPHFYHLVRRFPVLSGRRRPCQGCRTSLATLLGLIPMAMKLGTGAEAYAPLARSIIGGLLVSVVVTVYLVPAAYLWIHRKEETATPEVAA
jgi:hypothetical protein